MVHLLSQRWSVCSDRVTELGIATKYFIKVSTELTQYDSSIKSYLYPDLENKFSLVFTLLINVNAQTAFCQKAKSLILFYTLNNVF